MFLYMYEHTYILGMLRKKICNKISRRLYLNGLITLNTLFYPNMYLHFLIMFCNEKIFFYTRKT